MKIIKICFFLSCITLSKEEFAQTLLSENVRIEKVKFSKVKKGDCHPCYEVKRLNLNSVTLSFYEVFNDTVAVVKDGKIIFKKYIAKENNPNESSGYSGIDFNIDLGTKGRSLVSIFLIKQKIKLEVKLNKKFPLYTIQHYSGIWYINARKYLPVIK